MTRHALSLPMLLLCMAGCSDRVPAPPETVASAETAAPGRPHPLPELEAGARIYGANCVPCHQQDARGLPGVYPSLVGSSVLLGDPAVLSQWVILGRRPASMPSGRYPTAMRQFGWMKAQDAAVLFTYLRSHFGNSASAVDADAVSRAIER